MTKISVIIPVYNVEDYLEKCLDSLINQTLKDIEIICVNDESTDNSVEILEKYSRLDERIIIISQKNNGVGSCRNRGIEIAKGEYISFVDSDDWLELNALEELYENAINNKSDIVLFNSIEHKKNNEYKKRIYLPIKNIDYNNYSFNYTEHKNLVMNKYFVIWSKLYKTSFIRENNLKFQNSEMYNNIQFHIKSMLLAKKISYCPKIFYNYNITNINLLQSSTNLSKTTIIFEIINEIEDYLKYNNYFNILELNFLKFKINELKKNIKKVSNEFKNEFFDLMKKEFLKIEISSKNLEKLPTATSNWYINTINSENYKELKEFQNALNSRMKFVDRNEINRKLKNFKEVGINSEERKEKFIISLTSYPKRLHDIHYCLYSLLTQTFKPDKVILWLAKEEFPNKEKDIPKEILNLKSNGLSIEWCENLKSYKKLIPALERYPNYCIITADDDIFYPNEWLEELYESHLKHPDCIISKRPRKIKIKYHKEIEKYDEWKLITSEENNPSYINFPTNGAGTLFPPNSLNKITGNKELFLKLCPYGDDIWFWAMMVLNKKRIKVCKNPLHNLTYVNPLRELGLSNDQTLWNINKFGVNDIQLNNILKEFPEILEVILKELN